MTINMKKRIKSIVIIFIFSIAFLANIPSVAATPITIIDSNRTYKNEGSSSSETNVPNYRLYLIAIERVTELGNSFLYQSSAMMYDLDDDGVLELVCAFFDNNFIDYEDSVGYILPSMVFSVYDIENGCLVIKLDEEQIFVDAGAPEGSISVVKFDGDTLLLMERSNSLGDAFSRYTYHKMYDPNTWQSVCSAYSENYELNSEKNLYELDGASCGKPQYDAYIQSISYTEAVWLSPEEITKRICSLNDVKAEAVFSAQNLEVNGVPVNLEKYNINGYNYFKLRDLAAMLNGTGSQFNISYADGVVSVDTNRPYTNVGGELSLGEDKSASAQVSNQTIMINGTIYLNLSVFNIGGNNYFRLRELADLIGFSVDFDANRNTAIITSKSAAVRSTSEAAKKAYYNFLTKDLDALAMWENDYTEYYLVDLDGDGIDELYLNSNAYVMGQLLCWYDGFSVVKKHLTGIDPLEMIPGSGLILHSWAKEGRYTDDVMRFSNGNLTSVASGYGQREAAWIDRVYQTWNGDEVSVEVYQANLHTTFDETQAITLSLYSNDSRVSPFHYDSDTILRYLQSS